MAESDSDKIGSGCGWMLLFGLIFVALAQCGSDQSVDSTFTHADPETAYVTASALNCRTDRSTTAPKAAQFPYGEELTILDEQGGWSLVSNLSNDCWVSSDYLSDYRPLPKPKPTPQTLFNPPPARVSPAPARSCGYAPYCYEMSSCEEAQFYYRQCGVGRLDGDNDGIPCEQLC